MLEPPKLEPPAPERPKLDPPRVAWRSETKTRSALYRRLSEPQVYAYHWAPLTSGSRWFALWPLLLPFTLSNVAGFMVGSSAGWRGRVYRGSAVVQALVLTAIAVWWAWAAMVLLLSSFELPDWFTDHPLAVSLTALGVAALAIALVVLAATFSADGFERFRRRAWGERRSGNPWGADAFTDLSDPQFYDNGRAHKTRWWIHLSVAIVTAAGTVLLFAVGPWSLTHPATGLGWLLLGGLAATVILAMAMATANVPSRSSHAAATGAPAAATSSVHSWWLLGTASVISGTALLGGLVLSACLWLVDLDEVPPGPLALAYPAYGWAFGTMVVVLAACVLGRLLTPSSGEAKSSGGPAVPTSLGRLGARLAVLPGQLHLVLLAFAAGFVTALVATLALNWGDIDEFRVTDTAPVALARWTLALLLGFLFVNLVRSRANPASLRRIGTIWDVITFWPRTFHPFAVRSYAERAVPELEEILDRAEHDAPIVVLAHSQGSVLVYAAIQALCNPTSSPTRERDFALVTIGSPLRALYSRAFPVYFDPGDFATIRISLGGRWRNVFRYTDYVGRAVFVADDDASPATDHGADGWIVDPPASGSLSFHSHYWLDRSVRDAVEEFVGDFDGSAR